MARTRSLLLALPLALGACAIEETTDQPTAETGDLAVCSAPQLTVQDIIPQRSLAVTDVTVLDPDNEASPFALRRTLQQLVTQANIPGLTPEALFRQWWDTQNAAPGLTTGPHCSDESTLGQPSFNRFPWRCPRSGEGALGGESNPFSAASPGFFRPIGLFNRFDLAPSSGENCGEARIVYATRNAPGRLLAIFEAKIPNPTPGCLAGCKAVVDFWKNLSTDRVNNQPLSAAELQTRLANFYYTGLPGFGPVVHINNYAGSSGQYNRGSGQIRTNEFLTPEWELREFNGLRECVAGVCRYQLKPVSTKVNPAPLVFRDPGAEPDADRRARMTDFQNRFVDGLLVNGRITEADQIRKLGTGDINGFFMDPNPSFNSGSSNMGFTEPNNYSASPALLARISARMDVLRAQGAAIPQGLSAQHILARATAMSCGGCHLFSSGQDLGPGVGTWPFSMGFTHISEFTTADNALTPGGQAFAISSALSGTFLPHRRDVLVAFYNQNRCVTCPSGSPSPTPSGSPAISTQGASLTAAQPSRVGGERSVH